MKPRRKLEGEPPCPRCKRILNGYTYISGDKEMQPHDYCICAYCACPLRWNGFAYQELIGSALVLARLQPHFLTAEAIARKGRRSFR